MDKELKNQLLSHIPFFLQIPVVIIIIILPDHLRIYGGIVFTFMIIIQGLIYLFKRKIFLRSCYLSKIEKIIYGVGYIAMGVIMTIKLVKIL